MLSNITLHIEDDYEAMSKKATDVFIMALSQKMRSVFGFATGDTPKGLYRNLRTKDPYLFKRITAFNLDEYYPIHPENEQSYAYFMAKHLFDAIDLPQKQRHSPNGMAEDPIAECELYEQKLTAYGGIYFQVLGIGRNGHIGFNEPGESWTAQTNYVPLTQSTIDANSPNFLDPNDMPRHAITTGMRGIMTAKQIMLLASGENKAEILYKALTGPVTPSVPASVLQLHPDVTVVVDAAAGALFPRGK